MLRDVDVVDICTPTHLHCDMVIKAAAAGRQIICEKPLALNVEEGRKMISACKRRTSTCLWRTWYAFSLNTPGEADRGKRPDRPGGGHPPEPGKLPPQESGGQLVPG
jgi:hypothetical protein